MGNRVGEGQKKLPSFYFLKFGWERRYGEFGEMKESIRPPLNSRPTIL
jgi:hypothetical protein